MHIDSNVVKASMLFTGSWVVGAALATGSLFGVEPLRTALSGPQVAVAQVSAAQANAIANPAIPATSAGNPVVNPSSDVVVNPGNPGSSQPSVQPDGGQPVIPSSSNVNPSTNPSGGVPAASLPSGQPSGSGNPASVVPGGSLP